MALATLRRQPRILAPTDLKNSYRAVLDRAQADGHVIIRDRDDENLILIRQDMFGALETSHEAALDFAQFVAAVTHAIEEKRLPTRLELGRLSWAADLGSNSFRQFATEYIEAFMSAINEGAWPRLAQTVLEWRDTAAVEGDPELLARVLDLGRPEEHVDLPRPE